MIFSETSNSSYDFTFSNEYLLLRFHSTQASQLISFLESNSQRKKEQNIITYLIIEVEATLRFSKIQPETQN